MQPRRNEMVQRERENSQISKDSSISLICPICRDLIQDQAIHLLCGHIICDDCNSKSTKCLQCKKAEQNECYPVSTHKADDQKSVAGKAQEQDQLVLQMIKEGLNYDDFCLRRQHFLSCPLCQTAISNTNPPSLLSCGHVLCKDCARDEETCGVCIKAFTVKEKQFDSLLKYIDRQKSVLNRPSGTKLKRQNLKYIFAISSLDKTRQLITDPKSGDALISQILEESPAFQSQLRIIGKSMTIVIGNKSDYYYRIQNMSIRQFAQKKKILLLQSSTKQANPIHFYDRQLGG